MHAGHHVRPALLGKHVDLRLGVAAHEQEHTLGPHIRNESNGVVGEPFPQGHVAPRLARRHRQRRVEQAYVLCLEPPGEVAVLEGVRVGVLVLELLEDVLERGRDGRHGRRHREGQAHGLVRRDVRVLAEDEHLHLGRVHFEDAEDVGFLGVDRSAFGAHGLELPTDLPEAHLLSLEEWRPRRVHFGGVHGPTIWSNGMANASKQASIFACLRMSVHVCAYPCDPNTRCKHLARMTFML